MLNKTFIENNTHSNFTYDEFKKIFDEILFNKVYIIKSKKLLLSTKDLDDLEELLEEVIIYKELFYHYNKKSYFQKIKIKIHLFLLTLEVRCTELYD